MTNKIKSKLDEYLEFDSSLIFKSDDFEKIRVKRLIRIFGGAIRDIIADMPINDIDILSGAQSIKPLESILKRNGYHYVDSLTPKDLSSIYHDIKVINEPHTWIKGTKIVQIIRPVNSYFTEHRQNTPSEIYEAGFINLIQNVDMSCCGVSYDGEFIYENYSNAISHCINRVFEVNKKAIMYSSNRFLHRKYKLEDRGWKELSDKSDFRNLKLDSILNSDKFEYRKESDKNKYFEKGEKVINFSKIFD